MKKAIIHVSILSLLFSLALGGCSKPVDSDESGEEITYIQSSVFIYDEQELIDMASFIIQGTVSKVEQLELVLDEDGQPEPSTFAYVHVENSLKGGILEGNTIIVLLEGDGKTVIINDLEESGGYFEQGDNVLLFLTKRDTNDAVYKEYNPERYNLDKQGPYILVSYCQGRFWLNNANKIQHGKNKTAYGLFRHLKSLEELEATIAEDVSDTVTGENTTTGE